MSIFLHIIIFFFMICVFIYICVYVCVYHLHEYRDTDNGMERDRERERLKVNRSEDDQGINHNRAEISLEKSGERRVRGVKEHQETQLDLTPVRPPIVFHDIESCGSVMMAVLHTEIMHLPTVFL